ncbi:ABC transporter [Thermogemmatispora aurantia]|jgi:ABC-2 type transport system ATP-binding protein|uniref:ABC transporter ATP-binding protein n=1 Tax=Thermogemmatispora aurantia TaxID=2045279 RepID=UPI00124EB86D|nr:ATP-binding cassette domain-containing protein [Thermogemmatispora aurantia]GER85530.1 ABC transporter [Thermogemmatispora aurantia]
MTAATAVNVTHLRKVYRVYEREAGLGAALRALFRRQMQEIVGVDNLTFTIEAGEIIGFLGPNGAGKTTTLKMLAGLLYPSAGDVRVLGYVPWRRERAFLRQIALVMGQRQQLIWDIPVIDSFELNRAIYRIPPAQYRHMLDELADLLDLAPLLHKPVRNLSLGERMKCEIAGSLLHRPQVLFLDEPTIGLDIVMQRRIRDFIREYNHRTGATVLLTSHYMADVEALCRRVILIHHGTMLFDGDLTRLVERFSPYKTIIVRLQEPADLRPYGEVLSQNEDQVSLRVPKSAVARITARLLTDLPVLDLSVEDPPIEAVIEQIFTQEEVV